MEQNNEDVAIGKILDENSYNRDKKHINIDNVINIDFIKKDGIIHEVKKSNKIEDASIWQVKYYIYYLKQRGVDVKGKIDYPLLKKTLDVELEKEDIVRIEEMLDEIKEITSNKRIPGCSRKNICKKCAYHDLCFI